MAGRPRGAASAGAARITGGAALALSLCWPTLAWSASDYPPCTREPSDTDVAAAKAAFQAGNVAFGEADYQRAVLYWTDAYRRDCTAHALLLNLARAHELNGNKRAAVDALETYLERVPTSPERAQIERRIATLQRQLAEHEEGTTDTRSGADDSRGTVAPPPTPSVAPSFDAEPPARSGSRPTFPLVLASAGAGIALTGGGLWLYKALALDTYPCDYSSTGSEVPCRDEKSAGKAEVTSRDYNITGAITLGGAAIAATGIVWYLLSSPTEVASRSAPRTAVLPLMGPSSVGIGYTQRF
nr:MAG: hypothetical protein DIU78_11055 [Pseudomonadota bacterium]